MNKNLVARIENARYMGQKHRLNRKPLETNPFVCYCGTNGDGELIWRAFNEGWQECDKELLKKRDVPHLKAVRFN